jgi:hypothetical protein
MRDPLSGWQSFSILCATVSVGLAIAAWCCRDTAPARAQIPETRTRPHYVGQVTKMVIGQALVGLNPAACAEEMQLLQAGDYPGRQKLINDGLALLVEHEPKVRIIDVDLLGAMVRIRILTGPYAGRDGWVADYNVCHEEG